MLESRSLQWSVLSVLTGIGSVTAPVNGEVSSSQNL